MTEAREGFHFSAWSIKNPVPVIMMFLVLGIVGIFSFLGLGVDGTPNIDVPAVSVTVTQPGTGPTELESQVTKKVEDAIASLGDIDELRSTVTDGRSSTVVSFVLGTDSDRATNDVRNAIAQIRSELPRDIQDPIVERLEFADGAIVTYAVSSSQRSVEELSDLVDRTLARQLLTIPGVAQVKRLGGVDRAIRVNLNPSRLQSYGITATDVNAQIRSLNINLPGGRAELGSGEQNVRALGSAQSVEQLQNYRILLPNGATVPLANLGTVEDAFADPRQAAYLNGDPVVAFSVLRSTGSTLVSVEEGVRKEVEQLRQTLPEDVQLDLIVTLAAEIRDSYQATIDSIWAGCVLTTLVVGLFLRNWRVTAITGLALPLSIIPTFWVMSALDYTLNGMTLLALALAIGNLVDDAICMTENIDQHLLMGKPPFRAALDAAREIGLAVVATTATIVAVFVPVAFMGGIPGQFFQPFGVTVAVSTMFSTLVAVTIVPMLSAYWLRPKTEPELARSQAQYDNPNGPYRRALVWALRHRIATLLIAIAFFIGSLQLIPFLPKGLFTSGDSGLSQIAVSLPPGSTLAETAQVVNQVDRQLRRNPAVDSVFADINSVNSATVYVNLVPKDQRTATRQEFEQATRVDLQAIPGARISFKSQGAGGSSKDLALILKSENAQSLLQTTDALERQMRDLPGLVDVTSSASLVKPELAIIPNPDRAADLGVSVQAIANTAALATIGDTEANLAKFDLPDRQIPIWVKLDPRYRQDIDTLKTLNVPTQDGKLVPLSSVATIRLASGPAQIDRFDRARQVTVEANLEGVALGDAVDQVRALPAMNPLPADVSEEPAGDAEIMRDVFSRFAGALGLAVLSIYAILVLLYNSFLYPIGILAALPLSFGGAFLGLLVTQKELGLFALIGIVLLMGLVTKNAILLVDFALEGERRGMPQFKAVVEAGTSRLRPILMTSISTIAGMLPIALELGAGAEERSPMAISVIGGFTTSTLLTLIVVPVLFTYIDGIQFWLRKRFVGEAGRPREIGPSTPQTGT